MSGLDDLFRCERYGMLAHRARLRRQLERRPSAAPRPGALGALRLPQEE